MSEERTELAEALKFTHQLLKIQDLDLLLESLLTEARRLTDADAGSIYLADGPQLNFSYTQNASLQKRLPLGQKLIYATFSIPISSNSIAGTVAQSLIALNISDAYKLDETTPYKFDRSFDIATGYQTHSILTVPIKQEHANKVLGVLQLINALAPNQMPRPFTASETKVIQLLADSAALAITQAQMLRAVFERMTKMVALHTNTETTQHNLRIASYAVALYEFWARKKGVPLAELQQHCNTLRMAAMLYDVGLVGVPAALTQRPYQELTPNEQQQYRQHVIYGARLFSDPYSNFDIMAQAIALNHHEAWDGSGYPGHIKLSDGTVESGYQKADGTAWGKTGNEIPIFARIVSLAIEYERLSELPNASATPLAAEILRDSGKRWDPEVVAAFMGCLTELQALKKRYPC